MTFGRRAGSGSAVPPPLDLGVAAPPAPGVPLRRAARPARRPHLVRRGAGRRRRRPAPDRLRGTGRAGPGLAGACRGGTAIRWARSASTTRRATGYPALLAQLLATCGCRPAPDRVALHPDGLRHRRVRSSGGRLIYDVMDDLASFRNAPEGLRLRQRQLLSRGRRRLHRRPLAAPVHAQPAPAGRPPVPQRRGKPALRRRRGHCARRTSRQVAGYVGVLDERVDLDLIAGLAAELPDWTVRLVGSGGQDRPGEPAVRRRTSSTWGWWPTPELPADHGRLRRGADAVRPERGDPRRSAPPRPWSTWPPGCRWSPPGCRTWSPTTPRSSIWPTTGAEFAAACREVLTHQVSASRPAGAADPGAPGMGLHRCGDGGAAGRPRSAPPDTAPVRPTRRRCRHERHSHRAHRRAGVRAPARRHRGRSRPAGRRARRRSGLPDQGSASSPRRPSPRRPPSCERRCSSRISATRCGIHPVQGGEDGYCPTCRVAAPCQTAQELNTVTAAVRAEELRAADLIVVGSGFYGLTVAERIAAKHGKRVLVLERRDHLGGNAYSETEPRPASRCTGTARTCSTPRTSGCGTTSTGSPTFTGYQHRVFTVSKGQVYPMPINLGTICEYFGAHLTPDRGRAAGPRAGRRDRRRRPRTTWRTRRSPLIGRPLYEAFVRGYTEKQWQTDPRELPADVISRLPVRYTFDNRYFNDKYEGLPTDGYTAWLRRMAEPSPHRRAAGRRLLRRPLPDPGRHTGRLHRPARPVLRLRRGRVGMAHAGFRAGGARRSVTSRARR